MFDLNNIDIFIKNEKNINFGGSCALVGNSGNLLDQENGNIIDSHDFVIRCNEARTEGYEKYTGSKTDIRIVNSHMFHAIIEDAAYIERMQKIFSKFERFFLYQLKNENIIVKNGVEYWQFINVISQLKQQNNNVIFINPSFYQACLSKLSNHPTTGFIGLMVALKYFTEINCFGFSFFEEEDWSKKHYYEEIKPYDMSSHTFDKERQIFYQLQNDKKITMYSRIK